MPIVQVAGHPEAHGCLHEPKGPHADENAVVQVEEPLAIVKKNTCGSLEDGECKRRSGLDAAAWDQRRRELLDIAEGLGDQAHDLHERS